MEQLFWGTLTRLITFCPIYTHPEERYMMSGNTAFVGSLKSHAVILNLAKEEATAFNGHLLWNNITLLLTI